MIATIVNQMMAWSSMRPSYERVPALLVLDEAHTWLPEKRGATIPKENYAKLFDAFQAVGSTGRKRGLTPFFACPKISELSKSILYPGMYLFFRTSLHTDLQRVLEYVSSDTLTAKGLRQYISSLPKGKAIVKLPNGRQKTIMFHKRAFEHVSHTPGVLSALNKYASMPFDANGSYGMDMPEAEQEQPHVQDEEWMNIKDASAYVGRSRTGFLQALAKYQLLRLPVIMFASLKKVRRHNGERIQKAHPQRA
jgi:hypothetical protein